MTHNKRAARQRVRPSSFGLSTRSWRATSITANVTVKAMRNTEIPPCLRRPSRGRMAANAKQRNTCI